MAVLRLVAQGVDNQEIAQALNYSVYTVANRLRTIYEKLHVTNRTQAALYALRQGWATLDEPLGLSVAWPSPCLTPLKLQFIVAKLPQKKISLCLAARQECV